MGCCEYFKIPRCSSVQNKHVLATVLQLYSWFYATKYNQCIWDSRIECCCTMGKIIMPLVAACHRFRSQSKWPWSEMYMQLFWSLSKIYHSNIVQLALYRRAHHILTCVNFLTFSRNLACKFILEHTTNSPIRSLLCLQIGEFVVCSNINFN